MAWETREPQVSHHDHQSVMMVMDTMWKNYLHHIMVFLNTSPLLRILFVCTNFTICTFVVPSNVVGLPLCLGKYHTMSTTLHCYMLGTHRHLPSDIIQLVIRVFNECMDEYGYWDGMSSCLNCGFILKWAPTSTITQVLTSWNPWRQSWHSGLACCWDCAQEYDNHVEE